MIDREKILFLTIAATGWLVFVWAKCWPLDYVSIAMLRGFGLAGGVGALAALGEDFLSADLRKGLAKFKSRVDPAAKQLLIYVPSLIFYAWGIAILSRCWESGYLIWRDSGRGLIGTEGCDSARLLSGAGLILAAIVLLLGALLRLGPFKEKKAALEK